MLGFLLWLKSTSPVCRRQKTQQAAQLWTLEREKQFNKNTEWETKFPKTQKNQQV